MTETAITIYWPIDNKIAAPYSSRLHDTRQYLHEKGKS
jgi:hypothetical protein